MACTLATAIHFCIFMTNLLTLAYDVMFIHEHGERTWEYRGYAGKFRHLTFWDQIIQTVYFGLAFFVDVLGTKKPTKDGNYEKPSSLHKMRDDFFAGIVFPMGTFVVLTFWGIYAVDRELVYPKHLDALVPRWLNHVMHSTVILFLLIDKLLVHHRYPSRKVGLTMTVSFAIIYQVWIFWIAYYADVWVYPILAVLDWPKRAAFLAMCWTVLILIYLTGETLTALIWGSSKESKKIKKF